MNLPLTRVFERRSAAKVIDGAVPRTVLPLNSSGQLSI